MQISLCKLLKQLHTSLGANSKLENDNTEKCLFGQKLKRRFQKFYKYICKTKRILMNVGGRVKEICMGVKIFLYRKMRS